MRNTNPGPLWDSEGTINNLRCIATLLNDRLIDGEPIDAERQNALSYLTGNLLADITKLEAAWNETFKTEDT
ncbi:hypothetical protein LUX29_20575 [Aureimonas altamirensis]|uniref:hypothetical protein n=1 Tax=Aureimonas altamirensis TaxID=370622 RepID=UPI001E455EC3|nr:hypothetical protein [Aureimonas altamirensis]UHD45358.1 hypothetical protein LUX29_20575 [Aureimonas altamirensis]